MSHCTPACMRNGYISCNEEAKVTMEQRTTMSPFTPACMKRRTYVGGLPPTAVEQSIATFFSSALAAIGGNSAGPGKRGSSTWSCHAIRLGLQLG
eukprot:1152021-Pelagomonas_calceolata.AAC.6